MRPVQPSGALAFRRMSLASKTSDVPPKSSSMLSPACTLAANELASSAVRAVRISLTRSPNFGPNVFRFGLIWYLTSGLGADHAGSPFLGLTPLKFVQQSVERHGARNHWSAG